MHEINDFGDARGGSGKMNHGFGLIGLNRTHQIDHTIFSDDFDGMRVDGPVGHDVTSNFGCDPIIIKVHGRAYRIADSKIIINMLWFRTELSVFV